MPSTTTETARSVDVYSEIESLLKPYGKKLIERTGTVKNKRDYHLWCDGPIEFMGRKYPELSFASVIEQKSFVGLYLMAVYGNPAVKKQLSPALLKLLKGQSCFHVKQLTPELKRDISSALEVSYEGYCKLGWI